MIAFGAGLAHVVSNLSFVTNQEDIWNEMKWKNSNQRSNVSVDSNSGFCHRILIYNKTSGYSISATKRALADACGVVSYLLQVLFTA